MFRLHTVHFDLIATWPKILLFLKDCYQEKRFTLISTKSHGYEYEVWFENRKEGVITYEKQAHEKASWGEILEARQN